MDHKHIAGYTGFVPGEKWKFGTRSGSEPPPEWRGFAGDENGPGPNTANDGRPPSRRKSAKRTSQSEIVRNEDSSTQFPVRTTETSTQADMETVAVARQEPTEIVAEGRRSRPPSRNSRPPLDGRLVNNHAPHVLFMAEDPFRGLGNGGYGSKRSGRFYDQRVDGNGSGQGQQASYDIFPAAGYSGHIPGLNTAIGKPYGQVVKELKGRGS